MEVKRMSANVETMFSVRETPWHGLGTIVENAPTSEDAIIWAGLNWEVLQKRLITEDAIVVPDNYANVRSSDGKVLGVVGKRYQIVQNTDAFKFTDSLLGEGVTYETAGSLNDGKTIWLLAKMPDKYTILGDKVDPYICFTNTHDGSGAVKVAMTPVRVVCQNTLNMALGSAKRTWSARHVGSIDAKLREAEETLQFAHEYMTAINDTFEELYKVKLTDFEVRSILNKVIPINEDMGKSQQENNKTIRDDILYRFKNAPDLRELEYTGARLVQAVADTTSHIEPFRKTKNYEENRFKNTLAGNELLDSTMRMLLPA
jgi:phage/plasmid-like protein (TIGR03299 family)